MHASAGTRLRGQPPSVVDCAARLKRFLGKTTPSSASRSARDKVARLASDADVHSLGPAGCPRPLSILAISSCLAQALITRVHKGRCGLISLFCRSKIEAASLL